MSKDQLSANQSIRKYCLECSGDSRSEVKLCVIPDCPLYKYRLGKTGYHKKANPLAIEAMKKARESKVKSIAPRIS